MVIGKCPQGALRLVSIVSMILDTMRLVRHYGLKTTPELRHIWLDTFHLILDIIGITINSDSLGTLSSGAKQLMNTLGLGCAMPHLNIVRQ